ncbi:MAG: vWA domain-containing protein [Ardenticatenales bacterium]
MRDGSRPLGSARRSATETNPTFWLTHDETWADGPTGGEGCESIVGARIGQTEPVWSSPPLIDAPAQLAGDWARNIVVASRGSGALKSNFPEFKLGLRGGDVVAVSCLSSGLMSCSDNILRIIERAITVTQASGIYPNASDFGPVAITRDGQWLIMATNDRPSVASGLQYQIDKFSWQDKKWDDVEWRAGRLGPRSGSFVVGTRIFAGSRFVSGPPVPSDLQLSPDGRLVHFVAEPLQWPAEAIVGTLSIDTMTEAAPPIFIPTNHPYPDPDSIVSASETFYLGANVTFSTLTPDGRYLIVNYWDQASIIVADLEVRESWVVPIPGFIKPLSHLPLNGHAVGGVAIDSSFGSNRGLLAIHGLSQIGIYALSTDARTLEQRSLIDVTPPVKFLPRGKILGPDGNRHKVAPIAWSQDGEYIIAAGEASGPVDAQSWRVEDGGRSLTERQTYTVCPEGEMNIVNDIFTFNGLEPTPTPTPSRTDDPTATPTSTRTATPTRTASAPPTSTATASATPMHAWLPLALAERCTPTEARVDVVLALDSSRSMLEPAAQGSAQTKLEAATTAAAAFLAELRLEAGDQAGIVTFNQTATLAQRLTTSRGALAAALASIAVASGTRLEDGIATAVREVKGPRHAGAHKAAIVILTDGRTDGGPALAEARAAEAKASGVQMITVGLGADVDDEALARIASRPEDYHPLADAADLADVFRGVARLIPCPPSAFWRGR